MNYIGLINEVVYKLIADTNRTSSATFDYFRRYFRMHEKFELSLASL